MSDKILQKDISEIQEILKMPVTKENWELYCHTTYWKKLSKRVKDEAGNRCRICNGGGTLNVHHRSYANKGNYERELTDLVCLCSDCHALFHRKTRHNKRSKQRKTSRKVKILTTPERLAFLRKEYLKLPKTKRRLKVMRKSFGMSLKEWNEIVTVQDQPTARRILSTGILAKYLKSSGSKFQPSLSSPWKGYAKK